MHMTLPKFRFIPESACIAYRKKAATSSVVTGDNVMLKEKDWRLHMSTSSESEEKKKKRAG